MRKNIDFNEKVEADYRKRIIIDKDNPILAFKANRDRYSSKQGRFVGMPYIGSNASEDALTWNVFLTLYKKKKMGYLFGDYKLGRIRSLALWGFTPDTRHWNKKFQFALGNAIRQYDGILKGQTTEPDVVILGSNGVCVIECKLGYSNRPLTHLWEGKIESINKRIPKYAAVIREFNEYKSVASTQYYQLIRMAFYSIILAREYKVKPHLVSLTNEDNWDKGTVTPEEIWNNFKEITNRILPELNLGTLFWQELIKIPEIQSIDSLYRYLKHHHCL